MLEKRKIIEDTLSNNEIIELEVMKGALEKSRVYLTDGILDNIYYNGGT